MVGNGHGFAFSLTYIFRERAHQLTAEMLKKLLRLLQI